MYIILCTWDVCLSWHLAIISGLFSIFMGTCSIYWVPRAPVAQLWQASASDSELSLGLGTWVYRWWTLAQRWQRLGWPEAFRGLLHTENHHTQRTSFVLWATRDSSEIVLSHLMKFSDGFTATKDFLQWLSSSWWQMTYDAQTMDHHTWWCVQRALFFWFTWRTYHLNYLLFVWTWAIPRYSIDGGTASRISVQR